MTRNPKDFYPTPHAAYRHLVDILPIHLEIWEPACGDKRIIRFLKVAGYRASGDDLNFGYDFLKDTTHRRAIVTNPPFSLAFEFAIHANRLATYVALLLPLGFLASQRRSKWFKENPLHQLHILSKRPSFTQDGKTDAMDYAWFVWHQTSRNDTKGIFHL